MSTRYSERDYGRIDRDDPRGSQDDDARGDGCLVRSD